MLGLNCCVILPEFFARSFLARVFTVKHVSTYQLLTVLRQAVTLLVLLFVYCKFQIEKTCLNTVYFPVL